MQAIRAGRTATGRGRRDPVSAKRASSWGMTEQIGNIAKLVNAISATPFEIGSYVRRTGDGQDTARG